MDIFFFRIRFPLSLSLTISVENSSFRTFAAVFAYVLYACILTYFFFSTSLSHDHLSQTNALSDASSKATLAATAAATAVLFFLVFHGKKAMYTGTYA